MGCWESNPGQLGERQMHFLLCYSSQLGPALTILLKFFCQIATWCRMSSLGGTEKTSWCSSAKPTRS